MKKADFSMGIASALALALLASTALPVVQAQAQAQAPASAQVEGDYVTLYPGRYTPREAALVAGYIAENKAIKARGPIDVQALVAGTLPKETPGIGPVIKASEAWIRYNNAKYDPESRLRNDAAYARSLGFKDIVAFPIFGAHDDSFMIPWPVGARDKLLVSELNHSVTNYQPIYPGDTLYLVADQREFLDLTPPEGATYRNIVIETKGSVYNQRGEKVNDVIFRVTENVRVRKDGPVPKASFTDIWEGPEWTRRPAHFYTDKDWAFIKDVWSKEKMRGAAPLYWEDVKVGDQPNWTIDGPYDLSVSPIAPWGQGAGGSRTMKREIMNPKSFAKMIRGEKDGIWRLPNRADYVPKTPDEDREASAAVAGAIDTRDIHKEGVARSAYINYQGRDLAIRHLTNWAGDTAELETIKWSIMDPRSLAAVGKQVPSNPRAEHFLDRVPSMKGKFVSTHGLTGDIALVKSEVVGKYVRDGKRYVDLVWWIETIEGDIWEEGLATYRLAARD